MTQFGYCHCGCGQKTRVATLTKASLGHVKGQPVRFLPGHNHGNGPTSIVEWLVDENGCWVWQRATDNGYAIGRGSRRVHRVLYEEKHGPVPEGLQLDHLCRNRACVNPDHLEPVTARENQRRGANTKLTADEVRQIKVLLGSHSQTEVARRFGVSPSNVSLIASGRRWADVA